jgi:putative GTP pyrophosphokinase
MKHTIELKKFLAEYEQYQIKVLKPTHDKLKIILKSWENPEYWGKYTTGKGVATPSPIRMTMIRIKHPGKVVDKILRKSDFFPKGLSITSLHHMYDAIGIRVIVYFSSQLPLIDRELRSSNMFEISEESPPEAYFDADVLARLGLQHIEQKNKESGYSSIHYIVRLRDTSIPEQERPHFEIQVRTLAQELWSELEHVLSYKPENRPHFSAKRRFQILSREVSVIDEHFNLLYEDLIHNQEIVTYQDSDTLTFENLPKVLMEVGVQCALTELHPISKILFSRGMNTIGDLLKIAIPRRLVTIRNTYISTTGHAPDNLELISALAALKGALTKEIEIERVKSHIDYHQSKIHFNKEFKAPPNIDND